METAFIGIGSNVGDRVDFCDRAVTLLSLLPHSRVTGMSSLYETEPVISGTDRGHGWFLNGVVQVETCVPPGNLLSILNEIERALGRDQDNRAGPRTIDLDLLFYGDQIINEPGFIVPHPRLHQRRFVLVPLNDLAPLWIHPVIRRSVTQMLEDVEDRSEVRLLLPQPSLCNGLGRSCASGSVS